MMKAILIFFNYASDLIVVTEKNILDRKVSGYGWFLRKESEAKPLTNTDLTVVRLYFTGEDAE
jgi:hypothetical protein